MKSILVYFHFSLNYNIHERSIVLDIEKPMTVDELKKKIQEKHNANLQVGNIISVTDVTGILKEKS